METPTLQQRIEAARVKGDRPNWRVVTVRMPIEKHERYKRVAHDQHTSLNLLMVNAADAACDELEPTDISPPPTNNPAA
jgi:hypothetical protein